MRYVKVSIHRNSFVQQSRDYGGPARSQATRQPLPVHNSRSSYAGSIAIAQTLTQSPVIHTATKLVKTPNVVHKPAAEHDLTNREASKSGPHEKQMLNVVIHSVLGVMYASAPLAELLLAFRLAATTLPEIQTL